MPQLMSPFNRSKRNATTKSVYRALGMDQRGLATVYPAMGNLGVDVTDDVFGHLRGVSTLYRTGSDGFYFLSGWRKFDLFGADTTLHPGLRCIPHLRNPLDVGRTLQRRIQATPW